jgi:hypothetical protein
MILQKVGDECTSGNPDWRGDMANVSSLLQERLETPSMKEIVFETEAMRC